MGSGKKVLICAASIPFAFGGAELLVRGLENAIRRAGYHADTIAIPYTWDPPEEIFESAEIWRKVMPDKSPLGKVDLVVATKFPSYAVVHPNKVAWVLHQHRGAYELKGTIYDDFSRYPGAQSYREKVLIIDREYLSECREVFTISGRVSERMREYCGIESKPIYHPPPFDGRYYSADYSDDVLIVGRLEPLKRVDLAVNAMRKVKNQKAVLRIVGSGFLHEPLLELAEREGVAHRVRFEGFVTDEELLSMYAACGCVVCVSFEEDYGYTVLEAFKSRRPVVVTDDCGGPLAFVKDRVNGRVVPARPLELAEAIDEILSNKVRAKQLGGAGCQMVENITWNDVIERLVEPFV